MPLRLYDDCIAHAIRCRVRRTYVIKRDDARSRFYALEGKQVSAARSNDGALGANAASKRPIGQGNSRVVIGRFPLVACRRIRWQLDSKILSL